MGVIRKKALARGTDGGHKFICDVCSADITATVRIRCNVCSEYDLCVPCFKNADKSRDHDPATHEYCVIEQHSIPIFDKDWGADEELCLLEGAEVYGLGSWADIADHIGGYRNKDEVRDHYIKTYIESPNFPLPANADPGDKRMAEEIPRDVFQAWKKRRIEERRDEARSGPPATPKQKPTASVPACHEVQGYMPGRLEFETEFANDAEEAVQHMQFDPGDGLNPRTGELDPEMDFKMTVMDIYNARLTARADRKKVIFEHNLLDYKKNTALEKKKTKEELAIAMKAKPFARIMNHADFEVFTSGLEYEHNVRQAIAQLQDWRRMNIGDLKTGEKYEQEKQARAARPPLTGVFDRQAGIRPEKKGEKETNQKAAITVELTAPEMPERLKVDPRGSPTPDAASWGTCTNGHHTKGPLTNGSTNIALPPPAFQQEKKSRYAVSPLNGTAPLKLNNDRGTDLQLLTKEEIELCSVIRVQPKPYLVMKEAILREAMKNGGSLKRKVVKEICKIDTSKGAKLFEFFQHSGWIQKA